MIENKAYSDEEIDALINSTYDPKQHGLNLYWPFVIFSAIFFFPITIAYINSKLTPEFLFHTFKSPKWRNKLINFLKKESCVSYKNINNHHAMHMSSRKPHFIETSLYERARRTAGTPEYKRYWLKN